MHSDAWFRASNTKLTDNNRKCRSFFEVILSIWFKSFWIAILDALVWLGQYFSLLILIVSILQAFSRGLTNSKELFRTCSVTWSSETTVILSCSKSRKSLNFEGASDLQKRAARINASIKGLFFFTTCNIISMLFFFLLSLLVRVSNWWVEDLRWFTKASCVWRSSLLCKVHWIKLSEWS